MLTGAQRMGSVCMGGGVLCVLRGLEAGTFCFVCVLVLFVFSEEEATAWRGASCG